MARRRRGSDAGDGDDAGEKANAGDDEGEGAGEGAGAGISTGTSPEARHRPPPAEAGAGWRTLRRHGGARAGGKEAFQASRGGGEALSLSMADCGLRGWTRLGAVCRRGSVGAFLSCGGGPVDRGGDSGLAVIDPATGRRGGWVGHVRALGNGALRGGPSFAEARRRALLVWSLTAFRGQAAPGGSGASPSRGGLRASSSSAGKQGG
jgi:hypothetical protein